MPSRLSPALTPGFPEDFDMLDAQTDILISHTSSRTWVSDTMKERDIFLDIFKNLERMYLIPRSPFLPTTLGQWYVHRLGLIEEAKRAELRKIRLRIAANKAKKCAANPSSMSILPAFGGRSFSDNRSAVIAMNSIWSPWYTATAEKPEAAWPTRSEMEFEGDERMTSGFKRFPALARVPGNETVNWKCKGLIQWYDFDNPDPPPGVPYTEEISDDQQMLELVGSDLLAEIDA